MKFAKVFQQVLTDEHLPEDWIERAIQYKKLKKRINKVVDELELIGIKKSDLNIKYNLELINNEIHPLLIINITPLLKTLIIEKLNNLNYNYEINIINHNHSDTSSLISNATNATNATDATNASSISDISNTSGTSDNYSALNPFDDSTIYYELKISLLQDTKFFQLLYNEINDLNNFKIEEESEITNDVEILANQISNVTIPQMKKNDLYNWREIFQLYIESQIFFSTNESNTGVVEYNKSKERLIIFLKNLTESGLLNKFNQSKSILFFNQFKDLNFLILKISNFQNFNNLAIKKILKKFDKQTKLNSKILFPKLFIHDINNNINNDNNILNDSITKDICFIISNKLLNIIPQIDDYLCPICCSIAFKPIRLQCGHLFCIRCLVKLRRKNEDKCPLCRHNCLLKLTTNNLDIAQMNYMKLYFPKEVKEKELLNDKEILHEKYGRDVDKSCVIV